jgi:hypothetical protein
MPAPTSKTPIAQSFPLDGTLLQLLPRAGAVLRHPHQGLPQWQAQADGDYLLMRLMAGPEVSEVEITRRLPLSYLEPGDRLPLITKLQTLDLEPCRTQGLTKGLAPLADRRLKRLLTGLITFLNPRQMAILLYLYRLAHQQQSPILTFQANDLLTDLGYSRTADGGYASKLRSQLHCDLVALHRTELVFPSLKAKGGKARIRSLLRIKACQSTNRTDRFDMLQAADLTYELADSYSLTLEFVEGIQKTGDCLWLGGAIDLTQQLGSNAKNDSQMRLLIYLASRLKWDRPQDREYLILSKPTLFSALDLLGSNSSRNNQIFWRTVEALKVSGHLINAQELPGKQRVNSVQFQINPETVRSMG